jgi:hypothetical protein
LIGYRDIDTNGARFERIPFTADTKSFADQLAAIKCEQNRDEPEDVLGGMDEALKMAWEDARVRVVFHIGDSPHHGKTFIEDFSATPHGPILDRNPQLENSPRPYDEILTDFADRKIDYFFMKVKEAGRGVVTTGQMVKLFAESYDENGTKRTPFTVFDPEDFEGKDFAVMLLSCVVDSVSKSVMSYMAGAKGY